MNRCEQSGLYQTVNKIRAK